MEPEAGKGICPNEEVGCMHTSYLKVFRDLLLKLLIVASISLLIYVDRPIIRGFLASAGRSLSAIGNSINGSAIDSLQSLREASILIVVSILVSLRFLGLKWTLIAIFLLFWGYVLFQFMGGFAG